jgi:hypothetical protein
MKGHIMTALREQFERWDGLIAGLKEKHVLAEGVEAGWTIKDVMVHLWGWQQVSIARIRTDINERPPVFPNWINTLGGDWEEHADQTNTWLLDHFRYKTWETT